MCECLASANAIKNSFIAIYDSTADSVVLLLNAFDTAIQPFRADSGGKTRPHYFTRDEPCSQAPKKKR